jgi:arylsulfatase
VVELQDIMPTLLEAAGLTIPETVDGRTLVPLLREPAKEWRSYIHGEHCTCYSSEQEMQYVTDGRRKFIWLPRLDIEQFFNLENDPGECNNLIEDPSRQEEITRWRGYLTAELDKRNCGWVKDNKPHCPSDEPLISPFRDKRWDGTE